MPTQWPPLKDPCPLPARATRLPPPASGEPRRFHPPPPSRDYLDFVRRQTRKIFRFGWDKNYESFVDSFAPGLTARAEIGTLGSTLWASDSDVDEYRRAAIHGRLPSFLRGEFILRYKEIPTAGKVRPLGIPCPEYDLLGPLHRTMYSYMGTKDWLMVGPPTPSRIGKVAVGKVHTSIDLVGATDNLSIEVAETILGAALAKAKVVPGQLKVWAFESLRPRLSTGRPRFISHGQMMGTYLSFPLLCLQSYIAALWAAKKSKVRGVLVNGDDTLVSTDLPLGDYPAGFELNRQKTITSSNAVELNSTVFLRNGRGKWEEVSNLRRGATVADYKGMLHMAQACVKAGPRWQAAFVRSGVGRGWKLHPRQLGMSLRIHACWSRGARLRIPAPPSLPVPPKFDDDRFLPIFREPTGDEQVAFRRLLFNSGRRSGAVEFDVKCRKDLWRLLYGSKKGPRQWKPRPAFRSRPFGFFCRYDPGWQPESSDHRARWYTDASYAEWRESVEMEERSRTLRAWANPCSGCQVQLDEGCRRCGVVPDGKEWMRSL
nr:MAG: putative RNA-dependent RNA polymerase [Botourmiaviridae sp.]